MTTDNVLSRAGKARHVGIESQPTDSLVGAPTLINFLHAVPAPLVALLLCLTPLVASLRYVAQIFSWKTPWVDCWLLLAA